MNTNPQVSADLTSLRRELQAAGADMQTLFRRSAFRPLLDIAFDWTLIALAVAAVNQAGLACLPLSLLVIGNRQRALGNLLHDAGHGNLAHRRLVNDGIARLLLAGPLFTDLDRYRRQHMRHHQALGLAGRDPDLIAAPAIWPRHWVQRVRACIGDRRSWWGSIAGHLGESEARWRERAGILGWWAVALALVSAVAGVEASGQFAGLWLLSRATVFHVITTIREMCDHHGMAPGGVFSFTRDLIGTGVFRFFLHPRHNGYHLTHHLLPAVPYHRLPLAQRMLAESVLYRRLATVCDGYVHGRSPVVAAWGRPA